MKWKIAVYSAVAAIVILGGAFWLLRGTRGSSPQGSGLLVEATPDQIKKHILELNSPIVLVNFWASWCEPCKEEFPQILSLRKKLAPKGFKVVFISIDDPRDLAAAEEFLREQNVDFQSFYKGSQGLEFVTQIYPAWEGSVPTSILMGPNLKILDAWEGDATLAEFEERILRQMRGS